MTKYAKTRGEMNVTNIRPVIMFIDDEPENLNLLHSFFSKEEYSVRLFTSGANALAAASTEVPDLVLLDVRMPGMDGFDVCNHFKADEHLRSVPILFLSGLATIEDITKGLSLGAVDYITKPFRQAEVLARVHNHLALSKAYQQLAEQHIYLKKLEDQRDAYVHMLVHDMRSPLTAMLFHLRSIDAHENKRFFGEEQESLSATVHCTRTLLRMVSTLIDLSRMEHLQLTPDYQCVFLEPLFRAAREQVLDPVSDKRVTQQVKEGCPPVSCDLDLSARIIANLLANAIKYAPDPSAIVLGAEPVPNGQIRLWVKDEGPGISTEEQNRIFEKFFVTQNARRAGSSSTGLGLAFCKMAAEAQGGAIGVESEPGQGSLFWFTLQAAHSCKM